MPGAHRAEASIVPTTTASAPVRSARGWLVVATLAAMVGMLSAAPPLSASADTPGVSTEAELATALDQTPAGLITRAVSHSLAVTVVPSATGSLESTGTRAVEASAAAAAFLLLGAWLLVASRMRRRGGVRS